MPTNLQQADNRVEIPTDGVHSFQEQTVPKGLMAVAAGFAVGRIPRLTSSGKAQGVSNDSTGEVGNKAGVETGNPTLVGAVLGMLSSTATILAMPLVRAGLLAGRAA